MLSRLLAPLLLVAAPVLGVPTPQQDGTGSVCKTVTVTATVAIETIQAALAPGPTGIARGSGTAPQAIPASNEGSVPVDVTPEPDTAAEPQANATFPHGRGFTNAVYFTNWYVSSPPF